MARRACPWVPSRLPGWAYAFVMETGNDGVAPPPPRLNPAPVVIPHNGDGNGQTAFSLPKQPSTNGWKKRRDSRRLKAAKQIGRRATDFGSVNTKPTKTVKNREGFLRKLGIL